MAEKMSVTGSLSKRGDRESIATTYWMLLSLHSAVQNGKLSSTGTLLESNPRGLLKKSCLTQFVWCSSNGKSY